MTVYVDDMYRYPMGRYRGMKMSHMIGTDEAELHAMAVKLGVRRWYQGNHYDISLAKRAQAVALGAVEITLRQCGIMVANRDAGYPMGTPETCEEIAARRRAAGRSRKARKTNAIT